MWWRVVLLCIAYLLLGAHFLRFGDMIWVVLFSAAPLILLSRRVQAVLLLQAGLVISTVLVWAPTTYQLVSMRLMFNQPWLRLVMILGAVMLCNLLIAYLANGLKQQFARQHL